MDIDHGKNYPNRERISHKCNQSEYITSFRRGSLRGHLKTHSGEKLNKCNQCDYAICIHAGKHFEGACKYPVEKSQTNVTNATMHPRRQTL